MVGEGYLGKSQNVDEYLSTGKRRSLTREWRGSWAVSKFVSIIGQVVILVLVVDPQSTWPFRSFLGPASGSQCLCYSAWLCVQTRFNRRRCRGSDSDPGISG